MIQVNNISKSFQGESLFQDVSFNLPPRGRVGFVGRNGSGKSTLFKMIMGEESLDSGNITIPKNYKLGTLKQHLEFTKQTVRDECAQVLVGDAQYETYRVEKILSGLGFSEEDLERDPLDFSGGFQIRINLAKLLATEPNLLLLDEPTNYLDILSLRWLQNFLRSFDGEVLLITHDREFMDQVTTHTMGLHRQSLKLIQGSTEKFYTQLMQEEEIYEKTRLNHEKKKKEMELFVDRFRAKASKATQAQSKLKQLQKMENMEALVADDNLEFKFQYSDLPSKNLLQAEAISFGFEADTTLFENLSLDLKKGERIGIIGKNGKGKSTLLNCLAGELKLKLGKISSHPAAKIAHFGQTNISRLHEQNTIVQEIGAVDPSLTNSRVRQICGTMMFSQDTADKQIKVLSGGEKSRVMLGKILASPANLLLLDEPTNHLDMQSIESLASSIEDFPGGVVIVTHSEMLLKRLVNKLVIFHEGRAEYFLGGYEDFLEKIGWEEEEGDSKKRKKKLSKKDLQKARSEIILARSKAQKPLKKEIEKIEAIIIKSESTLEKHHQELIVASERSDSEKIQTLSKEIKELEKKVETNFEKLESLQSELDQLESKYNLELEKLEP